ncbi:MAG: diguanylate cyclase [Nevskia sp.]
MLSRGAEPVAADALGHRVRIELSSRLLAEGVSGKFPPELEIEYLNFHAQRVLALLRSALRLVPLLYVVLFGLDALLSQRLQTPLALGLCFGVGVPASLALLWLLRTPEQRPRARRLAPWCTLVHGLIVVALCADAARHGLSYHYELLSLVFAYTFFLGGLRPIAASLVAAAQILLYVGAISWVGVPLETLVWQLYYLVSLAALGSLGSVMLDHSQRRFWLQKVLTTEQSISDDLTGLHNHRHLKEQGDIVLRHAARELRSVALLLIDVDHFKAYNDAQGRLAGDECLRRLGLIIETTGRRPLDVSARYGGEEFAVLMYDCLEQQAQRRAEDLREAVARLRIAHPGSPLGRISVSIGIIAGVPASASRLESYTRLADLALQQAKSLGRDRVESGPLAR